MRNFTLENPQEGYVILSANAQEEFLKNYNATYHGMEGGSSIQITEVATYAIR